MSVPTHNLYEFIHQVLEKKFHLFYFYPWGQKNLSNLVELYDSNLQNELSDYQLSRVPNIDNLKKVIPEQFVNYVNKLRFSSICIAHDQEPLNFEFYQDENLTEEDRSLVKSELLTDIKNHRLKNKRPGNFLKHWIILHSELNSEEVKKYEQTNEYVCAYWWSHAVISRDWYRFAEHDLNLNKKNDFKKLFLIYARDCTGSRTYRKHFIQKLQKNSLASECQVGSFYKTLDVPELSASYNSYDIKNTAFSIILETIFDNRIHLTEKTCRALACGHPFIIANGPGALAYIRSYGFKTFSPFINEEYDSEQDNTKRLDCIIKEIERLSKLDKKEIKKIIAECNKIADYNKQLFFSQEFFQKLKNELKNNIEIAFNKTKFQVDYKMIWRDYMLKKLKYNDKFYDSSNRNQRIMLLTYMRHLKKGGTLEDYVPPDLY